MTDNVERIPSYNVEAQEQRRKRYETFIKDEWPTLRAKIQDFINDLPGTALLIFEFPNGDGFSQFSTLAMPLNRAIGLIETAKMEHMAGLTLSRLHQGNQ